MSDIRRPPCFRCGVAMTFLKVDFVGTQPVNVLHCAACDASSAAAAAQGDALDLATVRDIAFQKMMSAPT
jgi:hypothetical protein